MTVFLTVPRSVPAVSSSISPVPIQPIGEIRAFPAIILYKLLYLMAGIRLPGPVKEPDLSLPAGSGSVPVNGAIQLFPPGSVNPLGATALNRLLPAPFRGPNGSRSEEDGYYSDYPLGRKVAGKPIYPGSGGRKRCPRGHLFRLLSIPDNSRPGPYSWPPELTERAGP